MLRYAILLFAMFIIIYFNMGDTVFKDKSLKLGVSVPKSGIMKAWGDAVSDGANAYFTHVNQNHLLKNQKIKLIIYDDKYEPELTVENTNILIDKNVFALFGFVGTPTVKKILPYLRKSDMPFVAPFTGASFLRDAKGENIVNFRSSYSEEIDYIVEYLNRKRAISRFAVFYQMMIMERKVLFLF